MLHHLIHLSHLPKKTVISIVNKRWYNKSIDQKNPTNWKLLYQKHVYKVDLNMFATIGTC